MIADKRKMTFETENMLVDDIIKEMERHSKKLSIYDNIKQSS